MALLLFAMSGKELAKQLERRVGQCVLTCPTTAVYAGIHEGEAIALGKNLRFFGDGWQTSKVIGGRRYWRVPVMDGEFVAQETTAVVKAVGGGNLLLLARDTDAALDAAEAAVAAMRRVPDVVMPFPGGVVRSGSKVGSQYPALMASTNDAFCPTLVGLAKSSELDERIGCVMFARSSKSTATHATARKNRSPASASTSNRSPSKAATTTRLTSSPLPQ